MAKSRAVVQTENGSRYLQQLCKHWAHRFEVEFTPEQGSIDFGKGERVNLSADPAALTVEVEADDLPDIQRVVEDHIVRFAFRETLAFDWRAQA